MSVKRKVSLKKGAKKKRAVRKKPHVKKSVKKKNSFEKIKNENLERILVENFVSLQGIMSNLSVKFSELSGRISKLLELFENSAKALVEKDRDFENEQREKNEIKDKINNIFEQNKVIAKGISFLHDNENSPSVNDFDRSFNQASNYQEPIISDLGSEEKPVDENFRYNQQENFGLKQPERRTLKINPQNHQQIRPPQRAVSDFSGYENQQIQNQQRQNPGPPKPIPENLKGYQRSISSTDNSKFNNY